ncbi:baseplate wedge [Synechococcus phage S-CRM01]|uniref:baseplate wedge subunit n=1 Tax=Synechococcus phage S-CRM01 TaxID=1026955 RepID=UPI000209E332|nr:baseplate wedge subunit [Synechococcus phage S-CRM01]AEC52956.1 baseplate wedge [Synechococcus phage S-CRM01]
MTTVNSNDMRINNAKRLLDSLNGPGPNFDAYTYLGIGRPLPWSDLTDPSIDDSNPPTYKNNTQDFNNFYYQLISLKRLNDVYGYTMASKYTWSSGIVYDMYRHDYSSKNSAVSGATDLYDARFYVVTSTFDVYICLYNGVTPTNTTGNVSTVEPIGNNPEPFETSDGYIWLYIYTIPQNIREFITTNHIPIDRNYTSTPTPGEINSIVIDTVGTNYTSLPAGLSDPLPYYYCRVVGDGEGCVARVQVTNGSISKIEVVEPGVNYTYAKLDFTGGNVYKSAEDLASNSNGLNPLGDGNFNSTCIISPPGGWGYDLTRQLGATTVGLFGDLDMNINDFINDITFRQVGIVQNLEFSDIEFQNNSTLSGHYAVRLESFSGPGFTLLETINQTVEINGVNKIAKGTVIGWDSSTGILRYIQDPNIHTTTDGNMYLFADSNNILGESSNTIGSVDTTSIIEEGLLFANGYATPEIKRFSGDLIYISNIQPIQRDPDQTESIAILIRY